LSNRFSVRRRGGAAAAAPRAAAILAELDARGVPNGYGPQRFGQQGNNHEIGLAILRNDREAMKAYNVHHLPWQMRGFMVSALQSALFNQVVAARMAQGTMDDVLPGDVAKKTETGGLFTVVDVDASARA
jgi:tRNA pseudouridine13 synthase